MLFTGREVSIGKNVPVLNTEGTVFPYTDRPRPVKNVFIFSAFLGVERGEVV